MTKTRFLTLVMALALLLAIPTAVFAQRVPPHVFVGAASLNGVAAADGSAVTAWVDGELVADAYASGGDYTLLVDQGDSSFAGKAVSFKVSGVDAAETAEWIQGGAEVLDLVAAATGSTGSGAIGEAGASGAKGAKGDTGATGPAGSVGAAGAAGSNGSAGASGATGPAGSAGSAGASGSAGADGADGGGGLGVIALIVAIVALLAAGGSYMMGRRA
jgi:pilus assembly protein FimV